MSIPSVSTPSVSTPSVSTPLVSTPSVSKILVPVDFSERSGEAVRYAGNLARHFHAALTMLHVVEPPHADYAMVELPDYMVRLSKARHAKAADKLAEATAGALDGITVTSEVVEGTPAEEILRLAHRADIVVMPTQGHSRIREFLIGSVTAKVLHDCERPVLTGVHLTDNPTAEWAVSNVLCAIDFGTESANVLRWGAFLAREFGAKVSVVHADAEQSAGQRLQHSIVEAGLEAVPLIRVGEPHEAVVATARETGADLVIIGRGSNTSALGRLRAQAYEIVRKSPCPVLSV